MNWKPGDRAIMDPKGYYVSPSQRHLIGEECVLLRRYTGLTSHDWVVDTADGARKVRERSLRPIGDYRDSDSFKKAAWDPEIFKPKLIDA